MKNYAIAAIPADGIGPEVISAGVEVLHAVAKRQGDIQFSVRTFEWGSDYYKAHGVMMPEDGLQQLKPFDAIYFGAVGAPDVGHPAELDRPEVGIVHGGPVFGGFDGRADLQIPEHVVVPDFGRGLAFEVAAFFGHHVVLSERSQAGRPEREKVNLRA